MSVQIVCGSIAVAGALHGWGIYALLVTPVLSSVGVFAVNYCNYPQSVVFRPDLSAIRTVWSYSAFQFLFCVCNYFSRNADKLVIGKYFTMADLGYYDKSYRMMQLPLQNITFVISPVLHPILSTLQSDKRELARKNTTLVRYIACLGFPIGLSLFFGAHDIVNILFGAAWEPAVPVFRILALSLPLQMILSTSGALFQAAGKTDHMFYVGVMNTAVTVTGFLVAALGFGTPHGHGMGMGHHAVHQLREFLCRHVSPYFPQPLDRSISGHPAANNQYGVRRHRHNNIVSLRLVSEHLRVVGVDRRHRLPC